MFLSRIDCFGRGPGKSGGSPIRIHRPALWLLCLALSPLASGQPLKEVVEKTIASNPDILVEITERQAREQEFFGAEGGYLPSVDVTARYGREESNNSSTQFTDRWLTRREFGVAARQMIFDGFRTPSEVNRQKSRVNSASHRVFSASENTAARTVEVYLEVLRMQGLLEFANESLTVHERIFDQIKLRTESGVGRSADLAQIEARVALARTNVVTDETNLRDAETNYLRVVGELPKELSAPDLQKDVLPGSIEEAVDLAVTNHPVLNIAAADIEAAKAQHETAKANNYPQIDLVVGRTWNDDLDGVRGRNEDITAMIELRYNLFNGGRDLARTQQTAYLINQAKELRNRVYRQVVESIRLSWMAYQTAERQHEFLNAQILETEKTREAYLQQFNIGQRTLLDLLNTENELLDAKRSELNSRYDGMFAYFRVLQGMGKLLENLEIAAPEASEPMM